MTQSTQTPELSSSTQNAPNGNAATKQLFDAHTQDYDTLVNEAIEISGFDVEDLALVKLRKLAALFPQWSQTPIRFLDFGCGAGNLYNAFHGFFPIAQYRGVDSSKKMIQKARDRHPDVSVFFATGDTQWQKLRYDVIFASGVFHHIPHTEHTAVLQNFLRLLAPGGAVVIWEHNPLNPFTRKIVADCPFDKDADLIFPGKMKRLLRQQGLKQVQIRFTTFFPKFLKALLPLEAHLEKVPFGGQYIAIGKESENDCGS